MTWTFEQSTGKLYNPDGEFIAGGYSGGNCGKNPDGMNNPELQEQHGAVLPQGLYTRGTAVEHSQLGAFAIPLIPSPDNLMFGRSGFYMHGDNSDCNHSASEGCIIMPPSIRHEFYDSVDPDLQVVSVKIG